MRVAALAVVLVVASACGRGPRGTSGADGPDGTGPESPGGEQPPRAQPPPTEPPPATCPADASASAPAPLAIAAIGPPRATDGTPSSASADPCAGIEPPGDAARREFATPPRGIACHSRCMPGAGDATGMLAFPQEHYDANCHDTEIDFVASSGTVLGWNSDFVGLDARIFQQPAGLLASGRSYLGPVPRPAKISGWDSSGHDAGATWIVAAERERGAPDVYGPDPSFLEASAADHGGGVLFAGELAFALDGPFPHAAVMLGQDGSAPAIRWGPVALDSSGMVLGAGVDVRGRSLVLTDGASRFGAGHVAAQWLERDGTPLTCAFALLSGYAAAGDRSWLETSPLVGGGLLVRRVDLVYARGGVRAIPLAVVESGAASFSVAPDWARARPDTTLHLVRGGRAYAVLPMGAREVPCTQRLEVLAPDGTSCGAREYPIAGGSCDTFALTVAADGTVIQQLPRSMERYDEDTGNSCTWRWWTGALR